MHLTINRKGEENLAALCILLAAACGYDYRRKRIPNILIVSMAVLGVGWRFWEGGARGALFYLGEAVLAMCLLYPFFKIGSIGAGDVKLLGVTAGYLPVSRILMFLFVSLLISAMISLFKMWKESNIRERMHYLFAYLADVARTGRWRLYLENEREKQAVGICLSGPVLLSILLYWGGVY